MLFWFVLACGGAPSLSPRPSSPSSDRLLFPPRSDRERLGTLPSRSPSRASMLASRRSLIRWSDHTRATLQNPWAIAHGLVALGADLTLQNDQPGVEWLFETHAERVETQARWVLRFPESVGDTRVEPHPDLILKALARAGVDPDRMVKVKARATWSVTSSAALSPRPTSRSGRAKSSFKTPNDLAWTLMGLASWSEAGTEWTTPSSRQPPSMISRTMRG